LKVKVHDKTGRKTVAKVVGATSSEVFYFVLVFYVSLFCKHVRLLCVFLIKLLTYHTTEPFYGPFPGPPGWAGATSGLYDARED